VRLLAGVAHFRAPAATRERAPGRDAAHLQHGNGNAAGGPVKEIQESPDRAGAGRGKGVYRGPDCERRAEGDVHVIFCLPRRPRDTEKTLEPRICHRVLRGSVVLIRKMFAACEDFWGAWLGSNGCELSCGRGELGKGGS